MGRELLGMVKSIKVNKEVVYEKAVVENKEINIDSMRDKIDLLNKWKKVFINDEEFDTGELGEELGVWFFEIDIKPSKTKVVNGYYIYGPIEPQYGLFVEKTLTESEKYDVIKELVLNIIDNPLEIYGYNYK